MLSAAHIPSLHSDSFAECVEADAQTSRRPSADKAVWHGSGDVAYFAVASIDLSSLRKSKPCSLMNAARHNLREIQAEQGARGRIDPARTPTNVILMGPRTAAEVQAIADAGMQSACKQKPRRDHCQAIEALFSLPPKSTVQQQPYFQDCLRWLEARMGLPVLSAVVHNDEAAPHLHVLLLPVKGGKYLGSAPIGREELKKLRTSFFDNVAGPNGFKREGAKLRGSIKELAIKAVFEQLEEMELPRGWSRLLPGIKSAVRQDTLAWVQALEIDLIAAQRGEAFT